MARYYNIIKIVLLLLILAMIYYQVSHVEGQHVIATLFARKTSLAHLIYLCAVVLLMPINWWLESKKWQYLMSPHLKVSNNLAIRTILAGVAAGIMTPARLGEYGGRLVTSDPTMKTQAISATLLGSIAQNLCNVISGLGFSYFFLKTIFSVTYLQGIAFCVVVSFQIVLMILMYYHLPKVAYFLEHFFGTKYIGKFSQKLKSLDLYSTPLLHKVLLVSALRYVIYFCQYAFIMIYLGVNLDMITLASNISGIYLIQSGIPLPAFLSVFARGELAIMVWSSVGVHEMTGLIATFALWFINLIIPAFAGVFILMKIDLTKYFSKK